MCPQSGQEMVREEPRLDVLDFSEIFRCSEIITLGTSSTDRQYRRCADRAVAASGQLYLVCLTITLAWPTLGCVYNCLQRAHTRILRWMCSFTKQRELRPESESKSSFFTSFCVIGFAELGLRVLLRSLSNLPWPSIPHERLHSYLCHKPL